MAESIEITRRLKNQTTLKRCYFCDGEDFEKMDELLLYRQLVDGTICKTCGHIDLFVRSPDANKNGSN